MNTDAHARQQTTTLLRLVIQLLTVPLKVSLAQLKAEHNGPVTDIANSVILDDFRGHIGDMRRVVQLSMLITTIERWGH